jgi:hypothetical protein
MVSTIPLEILDKILIINKDITTSSLLNRHYAVNTILLITRDLVNAVKLNKKDIIKKVYDPEIHNWNKCSSVGDLEIIKWLHKNNIEGCSSVAMDIASDNGHLEVVKWLHFNRTEGCTRDAMDYASENGHLEVVKWLHENRDEGCTQEAIFLASLGGYSEIVNWLYNNRTECNIPDIDEYDLAFY